MTEPLQPSAAIVSDPSQRQTPDLEFPDWSAAVSEPRRLPWDAIYRRSWEALPFERAKPGFEERRLASKCHVEFVL